MPSHAEAAGLFRTFHGRDTSPQPKLMRCEHARIRIRDIGEGIANLSLYLCDTLKVIIMQRFDATILLFLALPVCIHCSVDVRLVDASGSLTNVGLLQIKTDSGFGSVCGANPAAADVVCRSLGFAHGTVSTSPCGFYGTTDLCGAVGSPVESSSI